MDMSGFGHSRVISAHPASLSARVSDPSGISWCGVYQTGLLPLW